MWSPASGLPLYATLAACIAYLAIYLVIRRGVVWEADRKLIRSQIDKLRAEIEPAPSHPAASPAVGEALRLLDSAAAMIEEPRSLLTSGARETAAWYEIHDAKILLASTWDWPRIEERLASLVAELPVAAEDRTGPHAAEAKSLATRIRALLAKAGEAPPSAEVIADARALLQRALRVLYSFEGEDDQNITAWHNKMLFVLVTGLFFVVLLAAAVGQPKYLLLGALGGFLSRLVRLRNSAGPSNDKAAWWVLFISPPLGALLGWAGVLLVTGLQDMKILGEPVKAAEGPSPASLDMHLAIAFLFGFSEALFESVLQRTLVAKTADAGADKKAEATGAK